MKGDFFMEVLIWAIMVVIFVIVEIATVQLVSIWLAAGAFVTMIATFFFEISLMGQLGIFLGSSAVFLVMSIPFIKKRMKAVHIATNSELDIGKSAIVIEEINRDKGTGRVSLSGVDWSAYSSDGEVIPKGEVVTVSGVKGAKLEVTPKLTVKECL